MRSVVAGPAPLYGMCCMRMPAMMQRSSAVRWFVVAVPEEPKLICPGFDFASAMNSWRFVAGTDGFTTISVSVATRVPIGAKSLTASYGVASRLGLITCVLVTWSTV